MDKETLFNTLREDFERSHPKSNQAFIEASQRLIGGGSHNLRLMPPFPFYDTRSEGAYVHDLDGFRYVDFWQGHFANILGHNPPVVINALKAYLREGQGLVTGFPGIHQARLADIILKQLGADRIRFTTSGTLASMYAIMLAKAFTKRDLVLKIGGGWHGAQPYALKGITVYSEGLRLLESAGLPGNMDRAIQVTRFNDEEDLEDRFSSSGEGIACLIVEPFMGAGGFLFGKKSYLQKARELTTRYGTLLIMDEVVSGFRFHPGGLQSLYGIKADLTILGKTIGGGMPVSAVAGRKEVMALAGPGSEKTSQVKFEGGTFSAHPMSMLAGSVYLSHLIANAGKIYGRIGRLGNQVRRDLENIFRSRGFCVRCTGANEEITEGSSLVGLHFLHKDLPEISSPDEVWNSDISDFDMRERIFKLAMLKEGFNTFHGFGGISSAHRESQIQEALDAADRIAASWKTERLKY